MNKEIIGYYQSNIKTSRKEDSVYAMKYASQQMLIDKLEQENKELQNKIDKAIKYIKKNKHYIDIEDMNMYLYEDDIIKVIEILKDSDVDE